MTQAAWITGASSGIGAALARGLARRGWRVALSGRNLAALQAVSDQCGGETLILPFDARDLDAARAAADAAWEWSGGLDMVVNNAGISQRATALESDFTVYEQIIAVDLVSPIAITQHLIGRMAARASGQLVFVSSLAGKFGAPLRTAYSAAKHGIIGYADALRAELTSSGVQVQVIAPGSIRTDVSRNALNPDGTPRGVSDALIESGIEPDEAAETMIAALERGEREIIVARGIEQQLGEMRRTPDELFDAIAGHFAAGMASQLEE